MAIPFGYQGNLKRAQRGIRRASSAVANSTAGRAVMAASSVIGGGSGVGTQSGLALVGNAQRFGFSDPSQSGVLPLGYRKAQYSMGWMAYTNEVFEQIAYARGLNTNGFSLGNQANYNPNVFAWRIYLQQRGLYARTMPLYNPVRQLVDFYASKVFDGALSSDGNVLPDGIPLAIPLGTEDAHLKDAIAQGWFWGNWAQSKEIWIRFGGSTGDGFVEIVDDVEAGNVYADPVWPGQITHVEFSGRGNVTAYNREHRVIGDDGEEFIITRVVTPDYVEIYKNGNPHEMDGMPAAYDNEFGFCPLVYNAHVNNKTVPGGMAVRNWNKLEKLNALASRLDRYIVKLARAPQLLTGGAELTRVKLDGLNEEDINFFTTESMGGLIDIKGNLDLAQTELRITSMIEEIEKDHPEVTMYRELATMSQVTGPAVDQLLGNVAGYLNSARTGYDNAEVRKNQMLVAIGGMRFKEGKGGWSARNNQQKKFAPFGLDSYQRGDLEHTILPRTLTTPTRDQLAQTKMTQMAAYAAGVNAEQPIDFQLGEFGENWPPEKIEALHKAQDAEHAKAIDQQSAMTQAMTPEQEADEATADEKREKQTAF